MILTSEKGPGGSGIMALQTIGEHIQTIAGDNYVSDLTCLLTAT